MYRRERTTVFSDTYIRVNDKRLIYQLQDKPGTLSLSSMGTTVPPNFGSGVAFLMRKFLCGTVDKVVPSIQRFREGVLMDVSPVNKRLDSSKPLLLLLVFVFFLHLSNYTTLVLFVVLFHKCFVLCL